MCPMLFREQSIRLHAQFDLSISMAMAKECVKLRYARDGLKGQAYQLTSRKMLAFWNFWPR